MIAERLPLLHEMLQGLLDAGRGREAEIVTNALTFVGGLLPTTLQQGISQKALEACQNTECQVRCFAMSPNWAAYTLVRQD